jgi:hypothetical protein
MGDAGAFRQVKSVCQRLDRRAVGGVLERVFAALSADADNECAMLDSTIMRAHQHAAGARKRGATTRRSGGGGAA